MSQKSQSGQGSNQSDLLPEAPKNDTQDETQDTLPITYRPRVSIQKPPPASHTHQVSIQERPPASHTRRVSIQERPPASHSHRVSIQERPPASHSHRVSIQERPPASHSHQVSIQEPPPASHTRQVSIQERPPASHSHQVSIQERPPASHTHRVSIQERPPASHTRRVSIQEPPPASLTRRVSIQEPPPASHTRRVSIQEPPPASHTRRVSIQEPPPASHTRRVSIQEPLPMIHTLRVSIQDPSPIIYTRRLSIQDPPPIFHTRRVSIQDPSPILHTRRVSIQDPSPILHTRRVSIQEPLSILHTRWTSIQDTPPLSNGHGACFQDTLSVPYSSHFHTQDVTPGFQTSQVSAQSPSPLTTHTPNRESIAPISHVGFQGQLPRTQSLRSSAENSRLPIRARVDIPPSITHSPEASINSIESILRASQETFKNSLAKFQFTENTLESNIHNVPGKSMDISSSRFQDVRRQRLSQLPFCRRLLHEARKISRQLSLLLSLAGMVILGLISLGQPWMHFQVPLTPSGDTAGPLTIPINTILIVRCSDISCMQEHDYNAYLLDLAWISLLIASITGSCLCLILINLIFFTTSNFPILDFSSIIISILTGTSIILGVLFYLMQAHEFLQEGMTYRLGRSFYLAWMGVFLFLMTGFFSYLNYINFWSILALQAIWT